MGLVFSPFLLKQKDHSTNYKNEAQAAREWNPYKSNRDQRAVPGSIHFHLRFELHNNTISGEPPLSPGARGRRYQQG
jgi:hypothetical protein